MHEKKNQDRSIRQNLEKAVYFTLTKNSPVVYSFKSIDRIRIIPKPRKRCARIRSKIIVESNLTSNYWALDLISCSSST